MPDADDVVQVGDHDYELIPWSHGKLAMVSLQPHNRLRQSSARRRLRRALRNTGITVECAWRPLRDGSRRILVAVFCWKTHQGSNARKIRHHIREAFTVSHPTPNATSPVATT